MGTQVDHVACWGYCGLCSFAFSLTKTKRVHGEGQNTEMWKGPLIPSLPFPPGGADPEMEYAGGDERGSWARIQVPLPAGCVTFSKSLAYSGPPFPYL